MLPLLLLGEAEAGCTRIFPSNLLTSMTSLSLIHISISKCKGVTELCAGPGYMKNWYPKEAFQKAVMHPFEDTKMPIPVGYDVYLKTVFGDYMKLPPKEKQKAQHDALLLDCQHSYRMYKGKAYCVSPAKDRKNKGNQKKKRGRGK